MKEFIDKIENYLFDFIGLFVPGFVLIILLFAPVSMINYDLLQSNSVDQSVLSTFYLQVSRNIPSFDIFNNSLVIITFVLITYILGHIVKVFSIIFYELGSIIFDHTINKLYLVIFYNLLNRLKRYYKREFSDEEFSDILFHKFLRKLYSYLRVLYRTIQRNLFKVFVFRPDNYFKENEILKEKSLKLLTEKYSIPFPDTSYSLFKMSSIMLLQENRKSLVYTFLSKYNLYRSLSFLFFVSFIYYYIIFVNLKTFLYSNVAILESTILISIAILWFTFHYKYKRYWTLCGNENLVNLFYYLSVPTSK